MPVLNPGYPGGGRTEKQQKLFESHFDNLKLVLAVHKSGVATNSLLNAYLSHSDCDKVPLTEMGFNSWNEFLFECRSILDVGILRGDNPNDPYTKLFVFLNRSVDVSNFANIIQLIQEQERGKPKKGRDGRTMEPTRNQIYPVDASILISGGRRGPTAATMMPAMRAPSMPPRFGGQRSYQSRPKPAYGYGKTSSSSFPKKPSRGSSSGGGGGGGRGGGRSGGGGFGHFSGQSGPPIRSNSRFSYSSLALGVDDDDDDDVENEGFDYYSGVGGGSPPPPTAPIPEEEWEDAVDYRVTAPTSSQPRQVMPNLMNLKVPVPTQNQPLTPNLDYKSTASASTSNQTREAVMNIIKSRVAAVPIPSANQNQNQPLTQNLMDVKVPTPPSPLVYLPPPLRTLESNTSKKEDFKAPSPTPVRQSFFQPQLPITVKPPVLATTTTRPISNKPKFTFIKSTPADPVVSDSVPIITPALEVIKQRPTTSEQMIRPTVANSLAIPVTPLVNPIQSAPKNEVIQTATATTPVRPIRPIIVISPIVNPTTSYDSCKDDDAASNISILSTVSTRARQIVKLPEITSVPVIRLPFRTPTGVTAMQFNGLIQDFTRHKPTPSKEVSRPRPPFTPAPAAADFIPTPTGRGRASTAVTEQVLRLNLDNLPPQQNARHQKASAPQQQQQQPLPYSSSECERVPRLNIDSLPLPMPVPTFHPIPSRNVNVREAAPPSDSSSSELCERVERLNIEDLQRPSSSNIAEAPPSPRRSPSDSHSSSSKCERVQRLNIDNLPIFRPSCEPYPSASNNSEAPSERPRRQPIIQLPINFAIGSGRGRGRPPAEVADKVLRLNLSNLPPRPFEPV